MGFKFPAQVLYKWPKSVYASPEGDAYLIATGQGLVKIKYRVSSWDHLNYNASWTPALTGGLLINWGTDCETVGFCKKNWWSQGYQTPKFHWIFSASLLPAESSLFIINGINFSILEWRDALGNSGYIQHNADSPQDPLFFDSRSTIRPKYQHTHKGEVQSVTHEDAQYIWKELLEFCNINT